MENSNSIAVTPRSSRSHNVRRTLRARTRRSYTEVDSDKSPKITSYFHVRKRTSPAQSETEDHLSKRLKRGVTISDAKFKSPDEPYPFTPEVEQSSATDVQDLAVVPTSNATTASRAPSAFGVFEQLPGHLLHDFINTFPPAYLVSLAMTSHDWSKQLFDYMNSKSCRSRLIHLTAAYKREGNDRLHFTHSDPFYTFGELLKATTVCQPTCERISALISFFEHMLPDVRDFHGWGRFLHTVSTKWAFTECSKVLRAVLQMRHLNLHRLITKLMNTSHGELPVLEMTVRNILRALILEPVNTDDKCYTSRERAFWLSVILRSQSSVIDQGRLLLILYGPVMVVDGVERIAWRSLVDDVVTSWQDAEERVKPLSEALFSLLQTKRIGQAAFTWTENEIFNVIEEITTFPEPWSFDNFVILLVHRPCMIPISICARIRHGYYDEAGNIFNTLKTLLYRWELDVCQIMLQPMTYATAQLDMPNRHKLMDSIWSAFTKQCKDFLLMGHNGSHGLQVEQRAQQAVTPILIEMAALMNA